MDVYVRLAERSGHLLAVD